MFNFMTDIRSLQYAVRVEAGGQTHPRLNQTNSMRLDEAAAHLCVKSFPASHPGRRQGSVWSVAIQVGRVGGPATGDLSFPCLCQGLFPYRSSPQAELTGLSREHRAVLTRCAVD